MKPLFKLFGFGVYRITGVNQMWIDCDHYEDNSKHFKMQNFRRRIKIEDALDYLSTLKGKSADKNKIKRILKGE